MSMVSWADMPYSVRLGASGETADQLESQARAAGATVIDLDLSGIADRSALLARLSEVFQFPTPTTGLDAALDWMSDLEWLDDASGYLVRVEGLDGLPDEVVDDFSGILPGVIDRWRSQPLPFVVALLGERHRPAATAALARSNQRLQAHSELPWARPDTGPVPVIDCRADADPVPGPQAGR